VSVPRSSSTLNKGRRRNWAVCSAKTTLPVSANEVGQTLHDARMWQRWFPGCSFDSESHKAEATDDGVASRFRLRTDFFSATVELNVSPTESHHATVLNPGTDANSASEFLLEGSDLVMGPIERFQVLLKLAPTPAQATSKGPTPESGTETCTAELIIRWKGSIPYFGFLFRPLFASYFKSFARQALDSLGSFVVDRDSGLGPIAVNTPEAKATAQRRKRFRLRRSSSQLRGHPWWAPAEQLSLSQTRALASLCFYAMVMGYMTSLAGIAQHQIIETFHADDAALGRMLFALGIGSIPGIFLLPFGDRIGRRKILLPALAVTAIASGISAFAPSLGVFTALQALVRAPLFVALSLAWIYLVEEMPPRGRAYAISLFTMTGGLGGGIGLLSLPWVQRISPSGWRLLFGAGLLALLALPALYHDLPETRRFEAAWHGASPLYLLRKPHVGRILVLLGAAVASSIFGSPAARFQGRYIQNALGYTPGLYVVFTVVTTLPAAPGMLLGGRIADSIGRKTVGILAATVGAISQTLLYWLSGAPLWISSAIGSFVGAMWIPAMGSFTTELFPTSLRANASSATSAAGMAGGATGSWLAGYLIVSTGSYGGAISLLLPAALVSGFLILLLFPETKGKELQDISPELRPPEPGFGGGLLR
jgi:MFS family permease